MIAANELRIGNWVLWNGPDHVENAKISAISNEEVAFKCGDYGLINEIQPIPLTPEILEKCGLKNGNSELDRNVFYSTNKHLAQFSVNISGSFGIYVGVFIALRSVHLEYLHQLQNIYFALTGEELNYTP